MMARGEAVKKSIVFAIPMSLLWSVGVWVGTLNTEWGIQGSLISALAFAVCYVAIAFISATQQNTSGGAFSS
jgi:hypothetical protein